MFARVPFIIRMFFRGCTWRRKTREKVIYLTFDDGPVPETTPYLLDLLDEYGWKATFFCVGENVQRHPELYREILARGHRTGNHTFNYLRGTHCGIEEYVDNVYKAAEYIDSPLFRPPHGRMKARQRRKLREQYEIIMWDVLTQDYNKLLSPDYILGKIRRLSRNGSIVVYHDSAKARNNLLATLPRAIEFWNEQGFRSGLL